MGGVVGGVSEVIKRLESRVSLVDECFDFIDIDATRRSFLTMCRLL